MMEMSLGSCPECACEYNTTGRRLVKESCGHAKCRQCLLASDDGCPQCQVVAVVVEQEPLGAAKEDRDEPRVNTIAELLETVAAEEIEEGENGEVEEEEFEETETIAPSQDGGKDDVYVVVYSGVGDYEESGPGEGAEVGGGLPYSENDDESVLLIPRTQPSDQEQMDQDQEEPIPGPEEEFVLEEIEEDNYEDNNPPSQNESLPERNRKSTNRNESSSQKHKYSVDNLPEHVQLLTKATGNGSKLYSSSKRYHCLLCSKEIPRNLVPYHIFCDPDIPKPFQCPECDRGFRTNDHFRYHMETHKSEGQFPCSSCPKVFKNRNTAHTHMRQAHSGLVVPHQCGECGKSFFGQAKLKAHMMTHSYSSPFQCSLCDRSFNLKENLTKHAITHSDVKGFECTLCEMKFKRKGALKLHMTRRHSDSKKISCRICGKGFAHATILERHQKVHQAKVVTHRCLECNIKCSRKDNITRHVRSMHLDGDAGRQVLEGVHYVLEKQRNDKLDNRFEVLGGEEEGEGGNAEECVDGSDMILRVDEEGVDEEMLEEVLEEEDVEYENQEEGQEEEVEVMEENNGNSNNSNSRKSSVIIYVGGSGEGGSGNERGSIRDQTGIHVTRAEDEDFTKLSSDKMEIYRKILKGGNS